MADTFVGAVDCQAYGTGDHALRELRAEAGIMTVAKAAPRPSFDQHVLSLVCTGALSATLRLIADQIDAGTATPEQFTGTAGRDTFELRAVLTLRGK